MSNEIKWKGNKDHELTSDDGAFKIEIFRDASCLGPKIVYLYVFGHSLGKIHMGVEKAKEIAEKMKTEMFKYVEGS